MKLNTVLFNRNIRAIIQMASFEKLELKNLKFEKACSYQNVTLLVARSATIYIKYKLHNISGES